MSIINSITTRCILVTLFCASSFSNAANQIVYSTNTHQAHYGDINGDGINDLLLQGNSAIYPSQWVAGEQDAAGITRYYQHNAYALYLPLHQFNLTLGDVNGDGYTDIITPQGIFFADAYGVGGMVENPLNALGDNANDNYLLKTGDFNGDGKADLLALAHNGKDHLLYHSQPTEGPVLSEHLVLVDQLKNLRWAKADSDANNDAQNGLAERISVVDINGDGFDDIFARAYKANKKHYLVYADEFGLFTPKNTKQLKAKITDVDWNAHTYWVNLTSPNENKLSKNNTGDANQPQAQAIRMNNYSGGIDEQGNITAISLNPVIHKITLDTLEIERETEQEKTTASHYLLPQTKSNLGGIGTYPNTYFNGAQSSYIPYGSYYNVTANAVTNAVFYRLYVADSEHGTYNKISEVSAPSNGSGPQFNYIFSGYYYGYRYLKYDACISASQCTGLSPWRRIVVYTNPTTPAWISTSKDPVVENDSFQVIFPPANGAVDGTAYDIYEKNPMGEERHIQTIYRNHWSESQYTSGNLSHTIAGTYHYRVKACNPHAGCSSSTGVSLVVLGNNDAPIAVNDTATAHQGSSVTINVLNNDKDPNGDSLIVTSASANKGSVTINSNGTLSYTSMGTGNDTGTITYTVSDQNGGYTNADVTVTINASNANPNVPAGVTTAPAPSDDDVKASAKIGLTKANFRVDESGAATYSMPIAMPSGIAGVTPSLAIHYNSNAPNSIMGAGWGLSGLSAITRCRQTLEQDGRFKAINLTQEDRFCYNGQRLIAVEGPYGADKTLYKTEIDTQVQVSSHGSGANGPDWFMVKKADGSVSYYGNKDTQSTAYVSSNGGAIISWLAYKRYDSLMRADNGVTYTYGTFGENEKLLTSIDYSGNSVRLVYNNAGTRPDRSFAYVNGTKIAQTARLDDVYVYNHLSSTVPINSYHLNYTKSGYNLNDQTQLGRITQCNGSKTGLCLPATTFDWRNDIPTNQTSSTTNLPLGHLVNILPFEHNGDGINDILYLYSKDNFGTKDYYAHVLVGDGNGYFHSASNFAQLTLNHDDEYSIPQIIIVDIEGDGLSELVIRARANNQTQWHLYKTNQFNTRYEGALLVEGTEDVKFADLNGDGLADLLYRDSESSGTWANYVRFNSHSGLASAQDAQKIVFPNIDPTNTTATLMSDKVADFNGDGLADVMAYIKHSNTYPWVVSDNTGTYNCTRTDTTHYTRAYTSAIDSAGNLSFSYYADLPNIVENTSTLGPAACRKDDSYTQYINPIHLADINNDGKTDVLYQPTVNPQYSYLYSEGNGFSTPTVLTGIHADEQSNITGINFIDTDHDNDLDLIYTSDQCAIGWDYYCIHQNKNGVLQTQANYATAIADKDNEFPLWLDVSADGQTDLVVIDVTEQTLQSSYRLNNHYSRIKAITDGFGVSTNISYKPLTDNSVYTKANDGHTITDYGNGSPVFDVLTPSYVVSNISSIAPSYELAGDTLVATPNASLNVSYSYQGLKAQAGGRGHLGFAQIRSYDAQSGISTQTLYRQDFPYIGSPSTTYQCIGFVDCTYSTQKLSHSINIHNDNNATSIANSPITLGNSQIQGDIVYTPSVYQHIANSWAYNTHGTVNYLGKTVTTTHQSPVYNNDNTVEYLRVNQLTVETFDASNQRLNKKETINQYTDNITTLDTHGIHRWWINRLSKSTVTHTGSSSSDNLVRTSAFEYDSTTGLLTGEMTEPDSSNVQLYSMKKYQYDDWGNLTQSTVCSYHYKSNCGSLHTADTTNLPYHVYRHDYTTYTNDGRYIHQQGNMMLGVVNTVNRRNSWGAVTQATDIDGVVAENFYDDFGGLYFSRDNRGDASTILRRLAAEASSIGAPAINETYHHVTKNAHRDGAISYVYTNKLGQQVATVSPGFAAGSWVYQYSRYNNVGRVFAQSLPSHNQTASDWHITHHDILGRPTRTVSADGNNIAQFTYSGLTTTTTSINYSANYATIIETKSQTSNLLGQTQSVTDMAGTIHYSYDTVGNLTSTTGVDGTIISIGYTQGRHKTSMSDPDKGNWTYQYNMLGELVSQTDPRGYITTIYRDNLGRVNRKITKLGSSTIETSQSVYSGHQLSEEYILGSSYKQCFGYDHLGRNNHITTILDGQSCTASTEPTIINKKYTQRTTFDQYGRVFQQFDPSGDSKGTENVYNSRGFLIKQVEARNSGNGNPQVLSEILAMDAQGNITSSKGAAGKITSKSFNPVTGLVNDIYTHSGAVQNINYQYDGVGNLRKRQNNASNITQTFTYDSVNRLTSVTGYQNVSLSYHANGNIRTKSDLENGATYSYANTSTGVTGSHALTSVGDLDYQYDIAGNQTHAYDNNILTRQITYSHINKPTLINGQNNTITAFIYNSSGDRYKRTDTKNGQITQTYYIGNIEVITLPTGVIETKRYVSNAIQTTRTNGTSQTNYLYYDNLGSVDAITNQQSQIVTRMYFGSFGQKHNINKSQWSAASQSIAAYSLANLHDITNRGYTGHEHLDSFNLIHING